ncbi:two-component system histidine kinase PnpS [Trichococcus paludicola]|uniref:two-component system histidine kinase PnpS n=1 Tax=Trichococcus paludicola TaxID=2052942 RepID=UPI001F26E1DD|nr:ATP-binding protein [Trichococcus paludicola]
MHKFTNQFLALFVGLFLLLVTGVVFYTNQMLVTATATIITNGIDNRANDISMMVSELYIGDSDTVITAVKEIGGIQKLLAEGDAIALLNEKGNLVFSSNPSIDSAEKQQDVREIKAVLKGAANGSSGLTEDKNGDSVYRAAFPLYNESGDFVGIFRLSHNLFELEGLKVDTLEAALLFSLVAVILASIIAHSLTRRLSVPLENIKTIVEQIAEENYEVRYYGADYPEISALGDKVNDLSDSLQEKTQTIQESNERINLLMDKLVIGVVLLDEEKRIQMMNPAVQKIVGKKDSLIGHSYLELFKSYGVIRLIDQTYHFKKHLNDEIYQYYPDEKILDVNTVLIPGNKGERGDQLIVLLYDITEIRRLEKVRTDFVTNASHELRTPVTALKGFAETLLDGAMSDPVILKQFLEIIYKESNRLDMLVNDILELSRVEQKQVPMRIEKININEITRSCFQIVSKEAEEKEITLMLKAEKEVYFEGDKSRFEQILSNLIYNAVNYTDQKGHVTVHLDQTDEEIIIQVKDTGIGIPEEDLLRIFERFYRVDKARSRNTGGTGLGLSIVRYLVKNMNGFISVDSKMGIGSTFTVRFPYIRRLNEE